MACASILNQRASAPIVAERGAELRPGLREMPNTGYEGRARFVIIPSGSVGNGHKTQVQNNQFGAKK